ncbi:MAG: hypothetical protein U1E17_25300 [Geminicoccaceae bacterium]
MTGPDRITTDMSSGRQRVRLLRQALIEVGGVRRQGTIGTLTTVSATEAQRLIAAGLAEALVTIVTKAASTAIVRLAARVTVQKSASSRSFRAIASTGRVDRQGDIVEPSGWRLDAYRRNPAILLSHDAAAMPVARATHVAVEGGALVIEGRFPEPGTSQRADEAWSLLQGGLLAAVSVGFLPIRAVPLKTGSGMRYLEQELLEVSLVSVPANSDCLVQMPLRPAGGKAVDAAAPSVHRHPTEPARAAEVRRLQREHVPERAARLATTAAKAGRPRLAKAARELAGMKP